MAIAYPLYALNVEDLHPHTQELLRSLLASDRMNVERFLSDLLNQATRTTGSDEGGREHHAHRHQLKRLAEAKKVKYMIK